MMVHDGDVFTVFADLERELYISWEPLTVRWRGNDLLLVEYDDETSPATIGQAFKSYAKGLPDYAIHWLAGTDVLE
jgi:hypothetical protein